MTDFVHKSTKIHKETTMTDLADSFVTLDSVKIDHGHAAAEYEFGKLSFLSTPNHSFIKPEDSFAKPDLGGANRKLLPEEVIDESENEDDHLVPNVVVEDLLEPEDELASKYDELLDWNLTRQGSLMNEGLFDKMEREFLEDNKKTLSMLNS